MDKVKCVKCGKEIKPIKRRCILWSIGCGWRMFLFKVYFCKECWEMMTK